MTACICRPRDPEGWYREDCPVHGRADETPPPCLNCGCPWDSCLVHSEFCCDACAHFEPVAETGGARVAHAGNGKTPRPAGRGSDLRVCWWAILGSNQ